MDSTRTLTLADQFAAAQQWWHEAGVDYDFSDEAQTWLAEPEGEAEKAPRTPIIKAPPPPPPEPKILLGGNPAAWPQDLATFCDWWLAEPSLDAGGVAPRIAPRARHGARLMVLVAEPEAQDRDTLLSGPQGKFLSAMLRAMGLAMDDCHIASALPRHTPLADWTALEQAGLGKILRHHITLAAPQRLLVFGQSVLPLLGHDPAQVSNSLLQFNHESGQIRILAARNLTVLMDKARERARFWRRWLDWMEASS